MKIKKQTTTTKKGTTKRELKFENYKSFLEAN